MRFAGWRRPVGRPGGTSFCGKPVFRQRQEAGTLCSVVGKIKVARNNSTAATKSCQPVAFVQQLITPLDVVLVLATPPAAPKPTRRIQCGPQTTVCGPHVLMH